MRYPKLKVARKMIPVHRVAYQAAFGDIPEGLCVCHKCDVTRCVRPSHLFLGTNQENTADKVSKGRQATGEKINSKLKPEQVIEMRQLWKTGRFKQQELAEKYLVTDSCVQFVVNYISWKHLP